MRRFLARRPEVVHALLIGGYLLVATVLAVESLNPPVSAGLLIPTLLAIAGVALILLRGRAPLLVLLGSAAVFLASTAWGTGAEYALSVIALYAVGARRSSLAAWLSFAGSIPLAVAAAWVLLARPASGRPLIEPTQPLPTADLASDILNVALALVIPFLIATLLGANVGERRLYVAALVERAAQLVRERDQQATIARAGERERIAREMHDVIAHSVSVMIAVAEGARVTAVERPAASMEAMERVAEAGRRTLGEVRRLLATEGTDGASPLDHAPQPGARQLPGLAEEFRQAGLPVQLSLTGSTPSDPTRELTVYRIVQESLTNALRHASGVTAVQAAVAWTETGATISVVNDGATVPNAETHGRGILGMKERAAMFGGIVAAGPGEQGGWRVWARLEWEA